MKTVVYTELASDDLRCIANYSLSAWREDGLAYFQALEEFCEQLGAAHAVLYQPVPRHPALRRMRFEHHNVYFRPLQTEIEIVRVLHVAMDADAEL